MKFWEAVGSCFSKYAVFSGRARRSEYWYFTLFNTLVSAVFTTLTRVTDGSRIVEILSGIFSLAVFLPGMAVAWRRMHDIGKSGVWTLAPTFLSIVTTILAVLMFVVADTTHMDAASAMLIALGAAAIVTLVLLIVYIVWLVKDGQRGPNRYGPDPKAPTAAVAGERPPWEN